MADVALLDNETAATPTGYTVPGAQEIILKSVTATFDGTGAGGSFVPTLEILAPNGSVLAACPVASSVAAGASADVSWFPRVGGAATKKLLSESLYGTATTCLDSGHTFINLTHSSGPDSIIDFSGIPLLWKVGGTFVVTVTYAVDNATPLNVGGYIEGNLGLNSGSSKTVSLSSFPASAANLYPDVLVTISDTIFGGAGQVFLLEAGLHNNGGASAGILCHTFSGVQQQGCFIQQVA